MHTTGVSQVTSEFRYERRGDRFTLKGFDAACKVKSQEGRVHSTPAWLTDIINIAKLGGAMGVVKHPPPDEILWFRLDREGAFTGFLPMER